MPNLSARLLLIPLYTYYVIKILKAIINYHYNYNTKDIIDSNHCIDYISKLKF